MHTASDIRLMLDLRDLGLDDESLEQLTQSLRREMLDFDEVDEVRRILDPNPPKGNKALGAVLVGLLTAEINSNNAQALFGFLSDRLRGKPITMEVEANGQKLKVTASSQQEFAVAVQAAQQFVAAAQEVDNG